MEDIAFGLSSAVGMEVAAGSENIFKLLFYGLDNGLYVKGGHWLLHCPCRFGVPLVCGLSST